MRVESKIWFSAGLACVMASGIGVTAQDGRFVYVESDDLLDTPGGTIEPDWQPPDESEVDNSSLLCNQNSKSTNNSGLGNNCSFCLSADGTTLESCKCDGDNKNHDDCEITIESGSGDWEVFESQYSELIFQVLRANGIDPGEAMAGGDLSTVTVTPGRRLKRQKWERK